MPNNNAICLKSSCIIDAAQPILQGKANNFTQFFWQNKFDFVSGDFLIKHSSNLSIHQLEAHNSVSINNTTVNRHHKNTVNFQPAGQ